MPTIPKQYLTEEEKDIILQLYKAHFTAREISEAFPFCYATIQNLIRGYKAADIQRYDRLDLINEETMYGRTKEYLEAINS